MNLICSLRCGGRGNRLPSGLSQVTVSNSKELAVLLDQGSRAKHVSATAMNAQSSRSHTIFIINFMLKARTHSCSVAPSRASLAFVRKEITAPPSLSSSSRT